jgi:hypothetical protein
MPFVKGQSGNPAGRPIGARNKVNREAEAALEAVGGGLVDRIIDHAGAGHPTAMRLCMDRMLPMGKHRPVAVVLPPVNIPDYALMAAAEISRAFAAGDISIDEAKALIGLAEGMARLVALGADKAIDNNNAESMAPERPAAAAAAAADEPALVKIGENTSAAADTPALWLPPVVGRHGNGTTIERLMGSTSPLAHLASLSVQKDPPATRARWTPPEARAA